MVHDGVKTLNEGIAISDHSSIHIAQVMYFWGAFRERSASDHDISFVTEIRRLACSLVFDCFSVFP